MGTINHRHVTILPDDPASDISADEWNDALVVRGTDLTGALLARDTGAGDGWSAIPAAAGILNCTGAGTLPTWSTSITLTGAITAGSLTTSGAVNAGSLTTTGVVTAGGLLTASGGITTSGPLLFSPDNTYDLGASGATRPRSGYFGTSIVVGNSPASTGALRLANAGYIYTKTTGGTDTLLLGMDTGNSIFLGETTVPLTLRASAAFVNAPLYVGTALSIGTNPATTGAIRLANNSGIYARNAANTADLEILRIDSTNLTTLLSNGLMTLQVGTWPNGILFNTAGSLYPATTGMTLGITSQPWQIAYVAKLLITDGIGAPSTVTGFAQIYVDSADGDLKVQFGDGVVKTIVVDT